MYIDPTVVYKVVPQLLACSQELTSHGYYNQVICDISATVLHCYAQLLGVSLTSCEIMAIQGPYNLI